MRGSSWLKSVAQKTAIIIAGVFEEHASEYVKHVQKISSLLDALSAPKTQWSHDEIRAALATMYFFLKDELDKAKNPKGYPLDASRSYLDMLPPDFEIFGKALVRVDKHFPELGIKRYIKGLASSRSLNTREYTAASNNVSSSILDPLDDATLNAADVLAEKFKRLNSQTLSLGVIGEPSHLLLVNGAGSSVSKKKYVKTQLKMRSPTTGRLCTVYAHSKNGLFYIRRRRIDGVWVHVRVKV